MNKYLFFKKSLFTLVTVLLFSILAACSGVVAPEATGQTAASSAAEEAPSSVEGGGGPVIRDEELLVPDWILVTKTADVISVDAPNGEVTFTVTVENDSADNSVVIESVIDDQYGDVSFNCNPPLPAELAPKMRLTCTFVEFVSGNPGDLYTNQVSVFGTDNSGNQITGNSDPVEITVVDISEPIIALPKMARTASGGSPFNMIPAPDLCNPNRLEGPDYTPLIRFQPEQVPNPFLAPGGFSLAIDYQNARGQSFRVVVSGANQQPVNNYVNQVKVCLEALPTNTAPPQIVDPVRLDIILIEAAVEETGRAQEELSQQRDELGPGVITLADVISTFGGDPQTVLDLATKRAAQAIQEALKEGRLTQEEANLDPKALLEILLNQLDAPFLFNPENQPQDDSEYANILLADPDNALVITLERLQGPDEEKVGEFEAIWFAIDPSIGNYSRYYKAKCQTSAWVRIRAWAGSMSDYFWRQSSYLYIGSRYANSETAPYPYWMYHSSSPNVRTYDTRVRGWQDGSSYSIYGGWYLGFGGGC